MDQEEIKLEIVDYANRLSNLLMAVNAIEQEWGTVSCYEDVEEVLPKIIAANRARIEQWREVESPAIFQQAHELVKQYLVVRETAWEQVQRGWTTRNEDDLVLSRKTSESALTLMDEAIMEIAVQMQIHLHVDPAQVSELVAL